MSAERAGSTTLAALNRFPAGTFLVTSAFEGKRAGLIIHWAQPCAEQPLLVSAALPRGHSLEPLIRDSHSFAVCAVDAGDRLLRRKFGSHRPPDQLGDPFDSLDVATLVTGAPILRRAIAALDCRVVRHVDLEADYELYVGQVLAGYVGTPARTPRT